MNTLNCRRILCATAMLTWAVAAVYGSCNFDLKNCKRWTESCGSDNCAFSEYVPNKKICITTGGFTGYDTCTSYQNPGQKTNYLCNVPCGSIVIGCDLSGHLCYCTMPVSNGGGPDTYPQDALT